MPFFSFYFTLDEIEMSVIYMGYAFFLILLSSCMLLTSLEIFIWWDLYVILGNGMPRFANYFQDHMVLQRAPQRPIVWGFGDQGVVTTLELDGKIYRTISQSGPANELGESIWSQTLDPQPASGPFTIKIQQPLANGTLVEIQIEDVLFGDVWLCSGQSNMQMTVSQIYNGSDEIVNADLFPNIRVFTAALRPSDSPVEELIDIDLSWSKASRNSVGGDNWAHMSAVCWLYGRMIHQELNVPIGLIATSWGGTRIEYWMPPEALQECDIST